MGNVVNAIELSGLTKAFGRHMAVDGLSLSVPQGSVYGFIGPNGSGKTTTLRMIMNILCPDGGDIHVFGQPLDQSCTDRIGYMPEDRGLYKRMKVREVIQFFGELKGLDHARPEVDRWLERLDLTGWANQKVETLSKGMSQKVQFIATVVSRPRLILLDEPFTGLDPVNTNVIKDAILDLQTQGTTVIFSTHDMSMAERMCDFIFMIHKGKKVLDGTLASIQDAYGHDTIRVRAEGGAEVLRNLPGVDNVNDYGQTQELHMVPSTDPQQVLLEVMKRTRLFSFDVVKPSLHDIFVRIATSQTGQANA